MGDSPKDFAVSVMAEQEFEPSPPHSNTTCFIPRYHWLMANILETRKSPDQISQQLKQLRGDMIVIYKVMPCVEKVDRENMLSLSHNALK